MVDKQKFRDAMGHFASGVTVVTVSNGDGGIGGLTANAFSSLSLDPPLILICVDNQSKAREFLETEKAFTVHFLANDQEAVATAFAKRGPDKANGVKWHVSEQGRPVLDDYLVALECDLENQMEGGDHMIVVGRVKNIVLSNDERPPLTYFRGQMNALTP